MKRLTLPLALEIGLGFAAHQWRSMEEGFKPVPFKRFRSVALLYGKW